MKIQEPSLERDKNDGVLSLKACQRLVFFRITSLEDMKDIPLNDTSHFVTILSFEVVVFLRTLSVRVYFHVHHHVGVIQSPARLLVTRPVAAV